MEEKNGLFGWELNALYATSGFESQGFAGFVASSSPTNAEFAADFSSHRFGGTVNSAAVSTGYGPRSKFSVSVPEPAHHDSPSFIDLKLGRLADCTDVVLPKAVNASRPPSVQSSTAKKPRAGNLNSGAAVTFCQVYGCRKDLSTSKDYHKKHKVCDAHSKTAKVIVNGKEQRFCQQCSRFHLLAEFDNGKRSCRKRLAGHNERRRKPRAGGILSHGNALAAPLITWQATAGSGDWSKHVNVEEVSNYCHESAMAMRKRAILHSNYDVERRCYPTTHENRVGTPYGAQYPHQPGPCFSSLSVTGGDAGGSSFRVLDLSSAGQGLSDSDCALSLLSSQSENSLRPPSVTHHHLIAPDEVLLGVSSQGSASGNGSGSSRQHYQYSSMMGSVEQSCYSDSMFFGSSPQGQANLESSSVGSFHGSERVDQRNPIASCGGGGMLSTIDLLQLSSNLERVECQRKSGLLKQETSDSFCGI